MVTLLLYVWHRHSSTRADTVHSSTGTDTVDITVSLLIIIISGYILHKLNVYNENKLIILYKYLYTAGKSRKIIYKNKTYR